ncbi:MAG: F0F1 ATP synthase subunit epsilon [Rhodobacterales bacterium]|jgi:F-type H+-transporting ATPase subunit epsilon|nr:F0F1 ATP synthase subunit epsilon [Rhodobacterales bacterium]MDX5391431.1 F0F1 ATP synthase subunit epsilon [Rhodobacterales bacterium]MDX5491131.1 F0F1 ATP synthase subunit epsilon [Rhodobacterales bacterium]
MAETMQFDLVSPERRLASMQVAQVQIPGADGDLTAMPDHAPLITTLRPGVLRVSGPQGDAAYVVTGGFAEISGEGTSVLAEKAMAVAEATAADFDALIGLATEAAAKAAADGKDAADKLLADLQALRSEVGV